jgi:hypothetical protein
MRGRAVAARRAHNPEVIGSNPVPATEREPEYYVLWFFVSQRDAPRPGVLRLTFFLKRRIFLHEVHLRCEPEYSKLVK